jgi:hypothetical protein
MTEVPRPRVTVAHPMTRASRSRGAQQPIDVRSASGVDEASSELALRSIMKAQGGISFRWFTALTLLLAAVFVVLKLFPSVVMVRVVGIPLAWLLLGGGLFPVFVLIASRFVQVTERLEQRFVALTGSLRSDASRPSAASQSADSFDEDA